MMMRLSFALVGLSAASDMHLIVGSPGVSFHRTANWVVVKGLERLGYTVDVVDQMPHRDMYPKFVAGDIDLVTGTDLPFNHAPWLWNHTDQFHVIGTVNEATDIVLAVPSTAGPTSVSELLSAKDDFTNEVLSLDEDTCPACVKQGRDFAASLNWTMREVTPTEFQSEVADRVSKNDKFVVSWYVPCYLQALVSGLVNLAGDVAPWDHHNVGKIVIRRDRMDKLDDEARNFLGAAFVGNDAIQEMDVKVNVDGMTEKEAATQWIEDHPDLWDSLFGILHDPAAEKEPEVEQMAQCSAVGASCYKLSCCSGLQCVRLATHLGDFICFGSAHVLV
jgi:ABC-type proline/glycine betaine transport system substrate-binding protein